MFYLPALRDQVELQLSTYLHRSLLQSLQLFLDNIIHNHEAKCSDIHPESELIKSWSMRPHN